MDKNDILEKSREENKNKDIFEKEIQKEGGNIGAIAAALLATVFFIIQIFVGGGMNYGNYAIVFVVPAAGYTFKAIKLKRKKEIFLAIAYWICVAMASAAHIYNLISSSEIL